MPSNEQQEILEDILKRKRQGLWSLIVAIVVWCIQVDAHGFWGPTLGVGIGVVGLVAFSKIHCANIEHAKWERENGKS
jgi:hypothetical protein